MYRIKGLKYYHKLRLNVLNHYGCKCNRCGFSDARALQIDHVDGGGTHARITLKQRLNWIVKNNYPENLQILCANCNCIKRMENDGEHRGKIRYY